MATISPAIIYVIRYTVIVKLFDVAGNFCGTEQKRSQTRIKAVSPRQAAYLFHQRMKARSDVEWYGITKVEESKDGKG